MTTVVKTYSSAGSKRLKNAALGISLDELIDGVLALGNLNLTGEPLAGQVYAAAAGDTVEDELVVKGSGDELLLAVLALPENEEVAGTGLGALALRTVEPEDLVVAAATGFGGGHEGGAIVGADLGVSEAANPSADHVLGGGVQAHAAGRVVHLGHEGDDDVEEGLAGALDAELGLSADEGRAEVEIGAGALLGEPLGAVDFEEGDDELLKLGGREGGE